MGNQEVTPWKVEADRNDDITATINYNKIINDFGCQKITDENINAISQAGKDLHRYFRRKLVFAHRDFDKILEAAKNNKKFFLYTGRGPSSKSMHLGHTVPFTLCKYLQDTFKMPIVIQITDDEKFLCKNLTYEEVRSCAYENIKDIIAFGFDVNLTYIFINNDQGHLFGLTTLKVSKEITLNDVLKVFGFEKNTNIGMIQFPAKQIAAAFASSFSFLDKDTYCLIPCAVDQDPYFRVARDIAHKLKEPKPCSLYVKMLPDLQGTHKKMSGSDIASAVYLDDDMNSIRDKIKKYAFSGGQETMELHRKLGGNPDIDVAFQYLVFFLEDDEELEKLRNGYIKGELGSGSIKNRCIEVIQEYVKDYQERRSKITDEIVAQYMDIKKPFK